MKHELMVLRRNLGRIAVLAALAAGLCLPHRALDPQRRVTQYALSGWTAVDGLPSNAVNALLLDRDGFLLVGTEDGLAQFDGRRFKVLGGSQVPALRVREITALARTRDGTVWIGTNGGGLVRMSGGRFTVLTTADGLLDNRIWALCADGKGGLWIGTASDGLNRMAEGVITTHWKEQGRLTGGVNSLRQDGQQRLWIAHGTGLTVVKGGILTPHPLPGEVEGQLVSFSVEDRRGRLWVATNGGVVLEEGSSVRVLTRKDGLRSDKAYCMAEDPDGNLWIGTYGGGLARISPDGIVSKLGPPEGLPDNRAISLLVSPSGSLWIGTRGAGLVRLWEGPVLPFGSPEGLLAHEVYPLLEDRRGGLWVGSLGGGLAKMDAGGLRLYTTRDGLSSDAVTALCQTRNGTLWAGTADGLLHRLDGSRFRSQQIIPNGRRLKIASIMEDRRGRLWVGTRGGGLLWVEGEAVIRPPGLAGVPLTGVYCMAEDRKGRIWLGTSEGLLRYEQGKFEAIRQGVDLSREKIFGLFLDGEDLLWLASYGGGLICLQNGKAHRLTAAEGLRESAFYQVVSDGRGTLWLSSNGGIVAANRQAVLDVVAGRSRSVPTRLFGVADGMRTPECSGGGQPAGLISRTGRVWFPTAKGLVSLDPAEALKPLSAPPMSIERVWVNGRPVGSRSALKLPVGSGTVEFRVASPLLGLADRASFRYWLEGHDREWTEADEPWKISYSGLRAGAYRLHLRCVSRDGSFLPGNLSFDLTLTPPLYRHPLFLLSVLALALLGTWAIVRARMGLYWRKERLLEEAVASRTSQLEDQKNLLQGLEARYRAVVEDQTDVVCRFRRDGRLTFVNGAMGRSWGLSAEEAEGRSFFEFLPPDSSESVHDALATLSAQSPSLLTELPYRSPSGERRTYQWAIRAFFGVGGEISGFQAVGRDVTDQRRLEERLRDSQRLEAVGKLAGGIAHDFNNLLQSMLGAASTLKLACATCERGNAAVREVEDGVLQASHLTRQLLLFAHGQNVRLRPLDLNAVVRNALGLLRRMAREDVLLELRLGEGPLPVLADSGQLEQVLSNLVLNAREAMARGGRIVISTAAEDDRVLLTVEDSGPGIPEEYRARIFEPFFTTKEEGRGLGLSVVHGVLQRCGGSIQVDTPRGGGTRFTLALPRTDRPQEAPASGVRGGLRSAGRRRRVLLVEDSAGVREWLAETLHLLGYEVASAASAEAAEVKIAEWSPELVLTDILLPDRTGLDLARSARGRWPEIRFIFMSGYAREEVLASEGEELHFLPKPFTLEALERELARVLEGPGEEPSGKG